MFEGEAGEKYGKSSMKHGPEKGVFQGQNGCYRESVELSLPDYLMDLDESGGVIHDKMKVTRVNASTEDNCDVVSHTC